MGWRRCYSSAVLARWLPALAAAAAGLLFAWHPVHVEAVANLVGRAELLVAVGILGAVLAARRRWWIVALACAALAMFSKEHGVIAGVVILLDKWLQPADDPPYPAGFWIALGVVTLGYLAAWFAVGWAGENDAAAVFYGRSTLGRLAVALPAVLSCLCRAVLAGLAVLRLRSSGNPGIQRVVGCRCGRTLRRRHGAGSPYQVPSTRARGLVRGGSRSTLMSPDGKSVLRIRCRSR